MVHKRLKNTFVILLIVSLCVTLFPATYATSSGKTSAPPKQGENLEPLEVFSMDGTIKTVEVPEDMIQDDLATSPAPPPPKFEVVKLQNNGSDNDNIVITIMGDGFTASQQEAFISSAKALISNLFEVHPFKSFKNNVNVYAIKVVSNVSGAAPNPGALIDNYFGSTFYYDGVTDRLLYITYGSKAYELINYYTPKSDVPVVLVNSPVYGGGGGIFAVTSCHDAANEILVHEMAHSVGGLADEYWYRGYEAPNMTKNNNTSTIKWKPWLAIESVGVYPFIEDPSWYRPHQNCKMRSLYNMFCEVCASQLTMVMAKPSKEPFYGRSDLESITMPGSATRIVDYGFYGCEKLTTVTITKNVKSIGRYAFLRCTNLTSITNLAEKPQTVAIDVFRDVDRSKVTLYIPVKTKEAYMAAGWTGFKEIVEVYNVTYDANGGKFNDGTTIMKKAELLGDKIGSIPVPTRKGFTFMGFFTAKTGGSKITKDTIITAPKTFYARWASNNAYLKGLKVSKGKLNKKFSKTRYSYTLKLNKSTATVKFTPVKANSKAKVQVKVGKKWKTVKKSYKMPKLKAGKSKTVIFKVTAADGKTTKTYKVKVSRSK